ncbi:TPA: hypothetical protein DE059_01325, partial [Candidatus Peribacteria bacterium]|nr:hypothetical protein [Candidatus Peribacteria bacterium]
MGSEITYGAGGPEIQVTVEASTDGGSTWIPLFGGGDIDGGEEQVIENLPSGSQIVLRFKGRHRWFWQKTYKSNDQTGHVEVLRDGNSPPDYQPYANQASLESFLQEVIDDNGKIDIGEYDVVLLGELGTLRTASSDFQDAVVLIEFRQKAGSCAGTDDPRFKIDFERLENFGTGNAARSVYVGPQQIRYTEGQWIPLKVNGVTVVDGGLVETVPGLAVERRNGAVRILLHGSHPSGGSKEIVDARITFDGALVQGADNDVGNDESESPFDGVVNDGPGGDEVTLGTIDALYQARVTILDDGIFINWLEGSTDSGSDDSGSDDDDDDDDDYDESDDSCSAQYVLNDGQLILAENAHVTFKILGSHARHGINGPEIKVRFSASLDGGDTWQTLYNFRDVDGGEQQSFTNVSSGSSIVLKAEGRYGWIFKKTSSSRDGSGRIRIFENGDNPPGTSVFTSITRLKRFMRNIMDKGKIKLDSRRVVALVELQDLNTSSDFSDAAVEIIMERPACGSITEETEESEEAEETE